MEAELHVFQEENQGSLFDALSDTEDITTLQAEVSSWRLGEYWTLIQNGRTILTIRTFISYLKHYLFMRMLYLKLDYLNPITLHYKNQFSEFSKFLLKKELLMSRLKNYDDKPESFAACKATFQSVVQE